MDRSFKTRTVRAALLALALVPVTLSAAVWAQSFTRALSGPIVSDGTGARSANLIDVNNDGYLDIFFSNGKSGGDNNSLYINNGDGTFTEVLGDPIVGDHKSSDGASFADFDNDGNLDAGVVNWYGQTNLLYSGNGDGSFNFQTGAPPTLDGSYSEACSWADYDNDGWLDFMVANSATSSRFNLLYHNKGDGTFEKTTTTALTADNFISRLGTWADFDNDNDLDLFVVNENPNGIPESSNQLFRNDGGGVFVDIGDSVLTDNRGICWGASWGDYDNDLDLDLFVATNYGQLNRLYQNNGDGTFTQITTGALFDEGTYSVGSSWIDYDNDADLDLFVANGFQFNNSAHVDMLFTNNGDGTFSRVSPDSAICGTAGWSYGCAWGDVDRDGDLDAIMARWINETENNLFFINEEPSGNAWLDIGLTGAESNASGVGARVSVKATVNGSPLWQMREITSTDGYCSQNGLRAHFGLGDATTVDSLVVRWPSGRTTVFAGEAVNQFMEIEECVDTDGDRICDDSDTCPLDPDNDIDGDGFCANLDNCPDTFNPGQEDTNDNGVGNACDVCCQIAGDADDSGRVTIGDVTFLLNRIFGGGPAPNCQDAADANGTNSVSIEDATFLIARIFSAGPAPVCGTTGT